MQKHRLERWLQNINNTQDNEISCSECFDLVSRFVEIELSNGDAEIQMPELRQHLNQCPACHAEYETLLALQQLENSGKIPSLEDLKSLIR